ncbi:hypothetical protein PPL_04432 [Heterostelium album PN500]|uniref:Uncharacterized protein n=1 Tax=Heterostelium pallidum (strain ATCC 26659 / Pp 5 / PN500) TaxID=670386 RepID=D3B7J4_HETP5|nr:hypothetical protein PPL_04432 [Heterostelium album PN500]EFA82737.1 hypothetical protein PPL_04432 [Heterostelium album PN500]|eukprot:XP_020434854.1 hypothetical protein PPL_04432 [Heterostelium album PN500]
MEENKHSLCKSNNNNNNNNNNQNNNNIHTHTHPNQLNQQQQQQQENCVNINSYNENGKILVSFDNQEQISCNVPNTLADFLLNEHPIDNWDAFERKFRLRSFKEILISSVIESPISENSLLMVDDSLLGGFLKLDDLTLNWNLHTPFESLYKSPKPSNQSCIQQ